MPTNPVDTDPSITLAPGESVSGTLEWNTVVGDIGNWNAEVASTDGSATTPVTVTGFTSTTHTLVGNLTASGELSGDTVVSAGGPPTTPITGAAALGDGTPLSGAKITGINDTSESVQGTAATDGSGVYSINYPIGDTGHVLFEHTDGPTDYVAPSNPFVVTSESRTGSASFDVNADGPGINATSHITPGIQIQGITYSIPQNQWYLADVTDTTTPSTIYEYNGNGTATGDTFQFPALTPTPNHANALQWHDGHLWCSGYNANTIFKIDWATKSIVGSFPLGNGVVDPDRLGSFAFIPTYAGKPKLLAFMWGNQASNAYLINYDDAIADGTAVGNIYRTLSDDIDTGRVQGAHYWDGALYITIDNMINTAGLNEGLGAFSTWGSYPIVKLAFPPADTLASGAPVADGRYIWWFPQPNLPYTDPIQDISHNPFTGSFWVAGEGSQTVFSGTEQASVQALPVGWAPWGLAAVAGPNNEWNYSIDADFAVEPGKQNQALFFYPTPGTMEVWFYDDLSATKRIYIALAPPQNQYNTNEHAIGVNTNSSTTHYFAWNPTNGWHTTGVTRPSTAQWVKFRWETTGSQTTTSISKDGGQTWTTAGTYTIHATALGEIQLQTAAGQAYIGPVTVTPNPP